MKLSKTEIESVSSLEPLKRYQYLIKRIADSEKVYTLETIEGNWASSIVKEFQLFPLWSAAEYAANSAIEAWSKFNIIENELNNFLETRLPEIERQGFLLNAFPVGDRTGFVVKPSELIRDLKDELTKYE
jgi:hypothetical protein